MARYSSRRVVDSLSPRTINKWIENLDRKMLAQDLPLDHAVGRDTVRVLLECGSSTIAAMFAEGKIFYSIKEGYNKKLLLGDLRTQLFALLNSVAKPAPNDSIPGKDLNMYQIIHKLEKDDKRAASQARAFKPLLAPVSAFSPVVATPPVDPEAKPYRLRSDNYGLISRDDLRVPDQRPKIPTGIKDARARGAGAAREAYRDTMLSEADKAKERGDTALEVELLREYASTDAQLIEIFKGAF